MYDYYLLEELKSEKVTFHICETSLFQPGNGQE